MIDYRFEEMVGDVIIANLSIRNTVINNNGEDYKLHSELFWRGSCISSFSELIPKDPGLKLAEKL